MELLKRRPEDVREEEGLEIVSKAELDDLILVISRHIDNVVLFVQADRLFVGHVNDEVGRQFFQKMYYVKVVLAYFLLDFLFQALIRQ